MNDSKKSILELFELCMQEFRKGGTPSAVSYPLKFDEIIALPDNWGGAKFSQAHNEKSPFSYKWVTFMFRNVRSEAIVCLYKTNRSMTAIFCAPTQGVFKQSFFDDGWKEAILGGAFKVLHPSTMTDFFFSGYCAHLHQNQPDKHPGLLTDFFRSNDFSLELAKSDLCTAPPSVWAAFLKWEPRTSN